MLVGALLLLGALHEGAEEDGVGAKPAAAAAPDAKTEPALNESVKLLTIGPPGVESPEVGEQSQPMQLDELEEQLGLLQVWLLDWSATESG